MASPARPRRFYEFGPFRLDTLSRVLLRDGEALPLGPTIIETLLVLVENRGSTVSKEELLKAVWPDIIVEENNLAHNISLLRKTLGEGPGEQRFIQTIPKRGYRFVAPVTEEMPSPEISVPGDAPFVLQPVSHPAWPPGFVWVLGLIGLAGLIANSYVWWRPNRTAPRRNPSFTQLTDQPGQELYPTLSPDGNLLAYASRASGNWDIYLQRVGGNAPINLTRDSTFDDTQPAFSPDGSRIAFRSERAGGGIFLMGATGESVRRITDFGYDPAWSPDGKYIVCATVSFVRPDLRPVLRSRLFAVDVLSGEKRPLAELADDAVQPRWSPGGHRIAYWEYRGGQRDIATVSVRGGSPVSVTRDVPLDWNPVWSPDGRYLYFSSDRGGSMNLWRVPIEEESGKVLGPPEPVTTPSSFSGYISFSGDGRRLAYVQQVRSVNLQRLAFDPVAERPVGQPVGITQGLKVLRSPDVSSDGKWITFSSGLPREDIFVMRTDGSGRRHLTDDPYSNRMPVWSPDDQRIAFCSNRTGKREVWIINADGSGLRQLTEIPGAEVITPVIWSPDCARLVCNRLDAEPLVVDPDKPMNAQRPEELPPIGKRGVSFGAHSWSPDGKKLAGDLRRASGAFSGLVVYSFADKTYQEVIGFGSFPVWLSDSRRLIFYDESKIYLTDSWSKRVREIYSTAPGMLEPGTNLSLSRDNRWIYFTVGRNEADIWLMGLR